MEQDVLARKRESLLMSLSDLSDREREIVWQALRFLLESEVLIHEFQTRLGMDEPFVEKLLCEGIDNLTAPEQTDAMCVSHNSLNEILHGLYISREDWATTFDFSRDEATAVLGRTEILWNMYGIV